jgi:hypothetical protein
MEIQNRRHLPIRCRRQRCDPMRGGPVVAVRALGEPAIGGVRFPLPPDIPAACGRGCGRGVGKAWGWGVTPRPKLLRFTPGSHPRSAQRRARSAQRGGEARPRPRGEAEAGDRNSPHDGGNGGDTRPRDGGGATAALAKGSVRTTTRPTFSGQKSIQRNTFGVPPHSGYTLIRRSGVRSLHHEQIPRVCMSIRPDDKFAALLRYAFESLFSTTPCLPPGLRMQNLLPNPSLACPRSHRP